MLESHASENFRNESVACAVEWSINDLEIVCYAAYRIGRDGGCKNFFKIVFIEFLVKLDYNA